MDIVVRATVIFLIIGVLIRISGKRQIAQLSAFDLILLVTVGDLIAQAVVQEDYSLMAGILAVTTFTLLSALMGWVAFRHPRARPLLEGRPTIVVSRGQVDQEVLRHESLPYADLIEAARENGIRDLRDVELAVIENDGTFSFFREEHGPGGARDEEDDGQSERRAPDKLH
jgi:uncharacterized membrane protein YcaP (DUF421 family)